MAKHQWTIVCQQVIVDRFSNNLTIVGVIERVKVELQRIGVGSQTRAPILPTSFSLVSLWQRSVAETEERCFSRFRIKAPSGKTVIETQRQELDLTGDKLRTRNIFNFRGFPLQESGLYRIHVQTLVDQKKWKTIATIDIPVELTVLDAAPEKLN